MSQKTISQKAHTQISLSGLLDTQSFQNPPTGTSPAHEVIACRDPGLYLQRDPWKHVVIRSDSPTA